MADIVAELVFRNRNEDAHRLIVEPWGQEFVLQPGERMRIVASDRKSTPLFEVISQGDSTKIVIELGTLVDCRPILGRGVSPGAGTSRENWPKTSPLWDAEMDN